MPKAETLKAAEVSGFPCRVEGSRQKMEIRLFLFRHEERGDAHFLLCGVKRRGVLCCPCESSAEIKGVPAPWSYSSNRVIENTGLTPERKLWAVNTISSLRSVGRSGSLGFLPLEPNQRRHRDALCSQWGGI